MSKQWGVVLTILLMILAVLNAVVCIFWGFWLILQDRREHENDTGE